MEKADAVAVVVNKCDKSTLDYLENKYETIIATCPNILVFVLDTELEPQIHDQDLLDMARTKRLPLFHLPNQFLSPKQLAPLFNSISDFLYTNCSGSLNSL